MLSQMSSKLCRRIQRTPQIQCCATATAAARLSTTAATPTTTITASAPDSVSATMAAASSSSSSSSSWSSSKRSSAFTTKDIDFSGVYCNVPTSELVAAWTVLQTCQIKFVSRVGPQLMHTATSILGPTLSTPIFWAMKKTFFAHFCAGESFHDPQLLSSVAHLRNMNIGVILDYSVEGESSVSSSLALGPEHAFDAAANVIRNTIEFAALSRTQNPHLPSFSCLKMTGLGPVNLFLRLSQILTYNSSQAYDLGLPCPTTNSSTAQSAAYSSVYTAQPSFQCRTPAFEFTPSASKQSTTGDAFDSPPVVIKPPPPLDELEMAQLHTLAKRLDALCMCARLNNIPLLIDAEQTYYQPAIDYLTLVMMKRHNQVAPIVHNTYQFYLADSVDRLKSDAQWASAEGFRFAMKAVRGAYLERERQRLAVAGPGLRSARDPTNPNIQKTHRCYDEGVEFVVNRTRSDNMSVVVASHNINSCAQLAERLESDKSLPQDRRAIEINNVAFAQLYGMGNFLTYWLVNQGQRVCKYTPFGPVHEVMPYLGRRLQENSDMMGGAAFELRLLDAELRKRFGIGASRHN